MADNHSRPDMTSFRKRLFIGIAFALTLLAGLLYGCLPGNARKSPVDAAPLVSAENGFLLFAAGDIAQCGKRAAEESGAARTAALIGARIRPGMRYAVLALGDTSYPYGLPSEYANCYEPTWGRFKANTFPAPGNHEYYVPSAYGYYNYFGDAAGPERRGYYSFDIGRWHIVSINSLLQSDENARQLAWLDNDLKRHKSSCILAFWHHPLFSSGGHGNNPRMQDAWRILQAAHADVVLNGHDHNYERFSPQDANGNRDADNGIREFIVGTGGARLTPFVWSSDNTEVIDHSTHGVLKMRLRDGGYDWEFLPVGEAGFSDSGTATCHPK